jgi:glycosyltransferase involved in cell wall biosynthesis
VAEAATVPLGFSQALREKWEREVMIPAEDKSTEQEIFPNENGLRINRQPLVSVVIPALNEAENLPYVLPRIPSWVHEVLLVDGHSTDNTLVVARRLLPNILILYQEGRGKGDALRTGFATATGDIIVTLDADGSADPGEMSIFIGALLNGADYVKGSRFLQGGGTADMEPFRFLGNWFFTVLVRLLFGGRYSDLCYGYNAFWKDVLSQLQLDASGFEIETLMNVHALIAGLKVVEVPSFEAKRNHGKSRLRAIPDGWRMLKTIVRAKLKNHNGHGTQSRRIEPGYSLRRLVGPTFIPLLDTDHVLCPVCGHRRTTDSLSN